MIKQRSSLAASESPAGVRSSVALNEIHSSLNHIVACTKHLTEQARVHGHAGLIPDLKKVHAATLVVYNLISRSVGFSDKLRTAEKPTINDLNMIKWQPAGINRSGAINVTPGVDNAWILVVDDDPGNCDILFRSLGAKNCCVEMASTADQAFLSLRTHEFDLVLLDVQLLGPEVYSILQQLKSDEVLKHIPVIVSSALSELDSVVRCIEMGAEDYLSRPFEPTLLQARIGSCLDKKRSHDGELRLIKQLQSHYKCLQELDTFVAALQI